MKKAVMMALCAGMLTGCVELVELTITAVQGAVEMGGALVDIGVAVAQLPGELAVEIEYQKTSNFKYSWFDKYYKEDRKSRPDDFAVINKVYRSDLRTLPAAALDVQLSIMKDTAAPKRAYIWPLPIINVVRAVKYTP